MKKNILFLIIIGFLACSFLYSNEQSKNDEFQNICINLSKNKLIRGDFELEQFSFKTKNKVVSSGNFTLSSDNGIIWFTTNPINSVMAVTDSYIIQEIRGKKRKIDGSKNKTFEEMAKIISSLFVGNYDVISEDFNIEYGLEKKGDINFWSAKLVSKNSTLASYIREVNISGTHSKNSAFIENIELILFNNDKSIYRLKNQKVIDNLSNNEKQYFEK